MWSKRCLPKYTGGTDKAAMTDVKGSMRYIAYQCVETPMSICGQAEQKSWPLDSLGIGPKNPAEPTFLRCPIKLILYVCL